jgi:hypothetical protein
MMGNLMSDYDLAKEEPITIIVPTDPQKQLEAIYQLTLNIWESTLENKDELQVIKEELNRLRDRLAELEKSTVKELEVERTEVDAVYELHRADLERKYFGRIVAIDTDTKSIVGIGDSILEAFKKAERKTRKDCFDYKRVGFDYIYDI